MKKIFYTAFALCIALHLMACSSNNKPSDPSSPATNAAASAAGNATNTPAPQPAVKKYDIKSGIITFSTMKTGMGITITGEDILFFDNFGMLERKDSYIDGQLKESILTDGVDIFTLQHPDQTAYKAAKAVRGTEYRFDWNEIAQTDRDNGTAKKLANMTLAGKSCEAYSVANKSISSITEFAGWNHICMYTKANVGGMVNTITATKVEENVAIPADKFKVPAGYKFIR
jgi:hypothetical protein